MTRTWEARDAWLELKGQFRPGEEARRAALLAAYQVRLVGCGGRSSTPLKPDQHVLNPMGSGFCGSEAAACVGLGMTADSGNQYTIVKRAPAHVQGQIM